MSKSGKNPLITFSQICELNINYFIDKVKQQRNAELPDCNSSSMIKQLVMIFVSLCDLDDKKVCHFAYHSVQTSSRGVLLLFAKLICEACKVELVASPNLHFNSTPMI